MNRRDKLDDKRSLKTSNIFGNTIKKVVANLHEKDTDLEQHCQRMNELCQKMGSAIGLSNEEILLLQNTALFHDIGKIAIDHKILNKPGKLSEEEWTEIKRHPEAGYRILCNFNLDKIAESVLAHHERWDGQGYPRGLKGEEIPLFARVNAIVDAYDAMTHDRCYRKALPKREAIKELKENAGTQFDPHLVNIFLEKVILQYQE